MKASSPTGNLLAQRGGYQETPAPFVGSRRWATVRA
jgi:hypothetical protein